MLYLPKREENYALHCQVLKAVHERLAPWGYKDTNPSKELKQRDVYSRQASGKENKASRHLTASREKASLKVTFNIAFHSVVNDKQRQAAD